MKVTCNKLGLPNIGSILKLLRYNYSFNHSIGLNVLFNKKKLSCKETSGYNTLTEFKLGVFNSKRFKLL